MTGLYDQLKADLDYLGWPRAAECFATLVNEAKEARWSHVEYLGKVVPEDLDRHARIPPAMPATL